MVSDVCEAFGIPPGPGVTATDQDYALTVAVLDYRACRAAVDAFNGPDKGRSFEVIREHPHLLRVLAWMKRAQDGRPLDDPDDGGGVMETVQAEDEGMRIAREYRTRRDGDDGE